MKLSLFVFLLFCFQSLSQTEYECRELLSEINSFEDLELLQPIFPDWSITESVITPFEKSGYFIDTIMLNAPLFSVHKMEGQYPYLLKVIQKEKREFCKLKYILVNSSDLTSEQIDQIQDKIISDHKSGKTIQELLDEYRRDGHPTGDLDWFDKETMASEFEDAVWNKSVNEVFKVNIHKKGWYYVVFKTHANTEVEVAHCVKVKICQVGCVNYDLEMIKPEVEAMFPGGKEAMIQFISDNVNYPMNALKDGVEGQVILLFLVEADGSISNISIDKGVSFEINNEAIRLLKIMPRWIPATHHGDTVRSGCRLPITFTLEGESGEP